ncbi:hypothetical protein Pyn_10552 [Prunus yedoensis var. nudiflora]|uniref:Uncharacterized protein n=1 Tax=Prunus yedoensis var. nudiflora TaxID=2094558 RepID=A0A314YLL9_PRUYE|nr:hypothetical protein Pyn_10552 [Prunus yedoensis var. nudiflora]
MGGEGGEGAAAPSPSGSASSDGVTAGSVGDLSPSQLLAPLMLATPRVLRLALPLPNSSQLEQLLPLASPPPCSSKLKQLRVCTCIIHINNARLTTLFEKEK